MATEKYEEKQESIAQAAFSLFRENGFKKTSVKDIADAAGIKKALVRYYFPKKESFEDLFLGRSLDTANEFIDELGIEDLDYMRRLYLLGYFELYYVCKHETMLKVGKDIMESRDLTRYITKTINQWIWTHSEVPEEVRETLADAILYSIGAAFEYIYFHLMEDVPFDIHEVFNTAVDILKSCTHYPLEVPDVDYWMPEDWLKEKCRKMDRAMFGI